MSQDQKPIDPPEKSLKYMAWSIKEISENIKKMTLLLEAHLSSVRKEESLFPKSNPEQMGIPF